MPHSFFPLPSPLVSLPTISEWVCPHHLILWLAPCMITSKFCFVLLFHSKLCSSAATKWSLGPWQCCGIWICLHCLLQHCPVNSYILGCGAFPWSRAFQLQGQVWKLTTVHCVLVIFKHIQMPIFSVPCVCYTKPVLVLLYCFDWYVHATNAYSHCLPCIPWQIRCMVVVVVMQLCQCVVLTTGMYSQCSWKINFFK